MIHRTVPVITTLTAAVLMAGGSSAEAQQQRFPRPHPRGFDFRADGVWRPRARAVAAERARALARQDRAAMRAGRTGVAAVDGVLRVPFILVRFSNTNVASLRDPLAYDSVLLGVTPPVGRPYTLRTYFEEQANGAFSVQGQVLGWVALANTDTYYAGPPDCNGLCGSSNMGSLMTEAFNALDASVDFGQFDNDGPDGIPNSGDDDGVVDLVALLHPEQDGACGPANGNIWSHRWVYRGWTGVQYQTQDARAGGGFIRIDDYTIQSAVGGAGACDDTAIMGIGTTAHEFGHGIDLPDLYDTDATDVDDSFAAGAWSLMAYGGYITAVSPAYLDAWSRIQLGWVTTAPISAAGTYGLGPVETQDSVFLVRPGASNSRGEYFLLENRQAVLADSAVVRYAGPGLLIWHIDSLQIATYRGSNLINTGSIHGVALVQADGQNHLRLSTASANVGDAGDPYPGSSANSRFNFDSNPVAVLNGSGAWAGFNLDSIRYGPGLAVTLRYGTTVALADLRTPVAGADYSDTLVILGATRTYTFTRTGGALPTGLTLSSNGVITGVPSLDSTFTATIRASSGGTVLTFNVALTVGAPTLAVAVVVEQVLAGTSALTADERRYLDLIGNGNGSVDVGDLAAWLTRTGNALDAATRSRLMRGARR